MRGDANDYVGKSMHGGRIRIRPVDCIEGRSIGFEPSESVIIGNTCLYGATGGKFFGYGRAGERFCVRNSNAQAVIEGTGDHCCEYMTGGAVVVLGKVGRNVGAGMTGGLAYLLEETEGSVAPRINTEIVKVQRVISKAGEDQLKGLIEMHVEATGSPKGKRILAAWDEYKGKFWQLVPPSEAATPEASNKDVQPAAAAAPAKV